MQRASFFRLVSQRLYPACRAAGFKGSGATLRRLQGPVLHVFNLQGSAGGAAFYVNLGATLTSLGLHGVTPATASSAKAYSCAFQERLDPPGRPRMAWPCPTTDAEADHTLDALARQVVSVAEPWFARHGTWPDSFALLTASETALTLHPAHMHVLARVALLLNDRPRAAVLARAALARCPATASSLRDDLHQVLAATGAA